MSTKIKYGLKELEKEVGPLTFGRLISSHRLGEEMSQKDFSKILGISPSSLCDIEKGRTIPSIRRARKMARQLKLSEHLFVKIAIQDQLDREKINWLKISFA
ncbi:MAG: helix-turn-helix transcriptional regulator [Bacteriovoracales bacterium]|nr:helix-turn-helix transcriptional regulator [Bacteriovoracales bacterium]